MLIFAIIVVLMTMFTFFGSAFYQKVLAKCNSDILKFLAFLGFVLFFMFVPMGILAYSMDLVSANTLIRAVGLFAWILPTFIRGILPLFARIQKNDCACKRVAP